MGRQQSFNLCPRRGVSMLVEDRFLLHASDRKNWRLRNTEEHPLDPGWEVGQYCVCHEEVRGNIKLGARIFDVVVKDGNGVIRSAFTASRAKGEGNARVLYFDDFYFADGEPILLPGHYVQYRQMKMSTWTKKYGSHQLWEKVTEQYTKYKKDQKPLSIEEASWDHIVARASKIRKEKDYERSSSSCRSECKQHDS